MLWLAVKQGLQDGVRGSQKSVYSLEWLTEVFSADSFTVSRSSHRIYMSHLPVLTALVSGFSSVFRVLECAILLEVFLL